jgi:peptide-methionine (R)-S-oxide reductase
MPSDSPPPDPKAPLPVSQEEWRRRLTAAEFHILRGKGTERAGTGRLEKHQGNGEYCCKGCGTPLYLADHKFQASCGWPAFDDEVKGAVQRHVDNSLGMRRVEITCARCDSHLGHVFEGEGMTSKNVRHCVNSASITFVGDDGTVIRG